MIIFSNYIYVLLQNKLKVLEKLIIKSENNVNLLNSFQKGIFCHVTTV